MGETERLILMEYSWIDQDGNEYVSDEEYYEMLKDDENDTSDG